MPKKLSYILPSILLNVLKESGYSLVSLAKRSEIPQSTLYSNFAGKTPMSLQNAIDLSWILADDAYDQLAIIRALAALTNKPTDDNIQG